MTADLQEALALLKWFDDRASPLRNKLNLWGPSDTPAALSEHLAKVRAFLTRSPAEGEGVVVPREPTEAILDAAVVGTRANISYADASDIYAAIIEAALTPAHKQKRKKQSPAAL